MRRGRAAAGLGVAAVSVIGMAAGTAGVASAHPVAAAPKVPLTIYAAEGYDTAEGKAFQAATGIPTKVDDDSTGPLTTKIEAEKNNPQWDVFWVDGDDVFASLDQQGLLLKHWEPKVNYTSLAKQIVPKDHSYIPTGVTMAAALVYNTKTLSTPPTTWSQLLSSKYKGEVGMNDPAVSGPTYPYIAGMSAHLGGVAQGENFYSKLKANGLHVYQTNDNTLQALETGTIKVATIQSSAGIGAELKSDPSLRVSYLKPETVLPSVIGIDAKVSKTAQAEAKQFVNFVFSKQGQKVMQSGDPQGDSLFWPLVKGEKPLPALPPISKVPTQVLNAYAWGPRENTINTWFTENIVQ
ncbi:MAG: extracellular solute-binding protein [Acidimicrobiaceae bacterium]|nr:extracellular solute-binding protein [Acidimicrobiaceae bacterium]